MYKKKFYDSFRHAHHQSVIYWRHDMGAARKDGDDGEVPILFRRQETYTTLAYQTWR
tara:strand:- start:634 stop:804 length:171 start_codon:yes stop_codon:yes gene_type:complete